MKTVLKIICIGLVISSCSKHKERTASEIYSEKATELVNSILHDEAYKFYDYLLEPSNESFIEISKREVPDFDTESYIVEKFNLNNQHEIDSLIGFHEVFIMDHNKLTERVKMVTRREYDSIFNHFEIDSTFTFSDFRKASDYLFQKYPSLCYISKPIFNKDYTIAMIQIDVGWSCLWMPPAKLKFDNGVWEFDHN